MKTDPFRLAVAARDKAEKKILVEALAYYYRSEGDPAIPEILEGLRQGASDWLAAGKEIERAMSGEMPL